VKNKVDSFMDVSRYMEIKEFEIKDEVLPQLSYLK
jgi:hypothetical protein